VPGKGKKVKRAEVSAWALSFADWFRTLLPEKVHLQTGWRESWGRVFDTLATAGRADDEIEAVCQYGRTDSFWSRNFFSPAKLVDRHKASGLLFYEYLLTQMNTAKAAPATLRLR